MRRGLFLLLFKRHSSAKSVDHYGHSIFFAVFTKCWTFQPRQLLRTFQPWALSSSIPYTLPRQYVDKRHNKCVNFLQVSSLATNSHFTGKGKLTYLYQCMHCTHTHKQKKKSVCRLDLMNLYNTNTSYRCFTNFLFLCDKILQCLEKDISANNWHTIFIVSYRNMFFVHFSAFLSGCWLCFRSCHPNVHSPVHRLPVCQHRHWS